jgi:hypothetical protein
MAIGLFLLTSDAVPNLGEDEEFLLVTPEEEGEDECTGSLDESDLAPDLHACITTLVADYDNWEALRHDVSEWWRELTQSTPVLELLATDLTLMSEDQRESIAELKGQSWSIRTPVVVFRKDRPGAALEARKFVTECALSEN